LHDLAPADDENDNFTLSNPVISRKTLRFIDSAEMFRIMHL
jgi:hypothetical protein